MPIIEIGTTLQASAWRQLPAAYRITVKNMYTLASTEERKMMERLFGEKNLTRPVMERELVKAIPLVQLKTLINDFTHDLGKVQKDIVSLLEGETVQDCQESSKGEIKVGSYVRVLLSCNASDIGKVGMVVGYGSDDLIAVSYDNEEGVYKHSLESLELID